MVSGNANAGIDAEAVPGFIAVVAIWFSLVEALGESLS